MFKQLIFDCDGVLVDTEIVAANVMVKKLTQFDVKITVDHYLKTYTGSTFSGIFKENIKNLSANDLALLVKGCEEEVYEELKPIKGMSQLVKSLKIPKAVVSNSYLWQVKKALEVTGINTNIDFYCSSEEVEFPKPSPDVYLLAAKRAGCTPEECLVVEDSKSGVSAALSAGMNVIGFTGGSHVTKDHGRLLKEKGAIDVADSADQLLPIINKLLLS